MNADAVQDRLGNPSFTGIKLEKFDETTYATYRNVQTIVWKKIIGSKRQS
jgi:hypothetical protein